MTRSASIISIILCICMIITSAVFLGLWQNEKCDKSEIRSIAVSAASASLEDFKLYKETGNIRYYNSAVAEFYAFEKAYEQLVYNTNKSANFLFCNEVYGSLIMMPEKSVAHIDEIIEAMEFIVTDIDDPNGHNSMSRLRNSIKE